MHIENLKVFCALVETRSFSRAAEQVFISPSAVSQQVRALETMFGHKLIQRARGSMIEPTDAGKILYNRAKLILERFNRLEDEITGQAPPVTGIVRLTTIKSVGLYALPPYIKRFTAAHPYIMVNVQYRQSDQAYESILADTVDLGVVAYPTSHPQIEIIPFRDEQLVFVCSPDHPHARQRRVT